MFFRNFYLPQNLYKDETEIWDALAKINRSGRNIDPNIYRIFKTVIDRILKYRNIRDYHPLDYPIVRYFLCPDSCYGVLNLPSIQRPEFIEQFAQKFDDELVNSFFQEITAQPPDKFYIDLESLSAVWQGAKFLEMNEAKVCEYHPQNGTGGDVRFQLNNIDWIAEVKNLNHEDISLHCVAQMLAGLMSLKKEGKELRDWNNITLEGRNIDDNFRTEVIKLLRKEIGVVLSEAGGNNQLLVKKNVDGLRISIYTSSQSRTIIILAQNSNRCLTLKLHKVPKNSSYYTIGPSPAYFWPEPLPCAFYKKLNACLTKIENQKKVNAHYLGFLHLEVPYKYSNRQEEQKWQQTIKDKLNLKTFPVVLHTWVPNQTNGSLKILELIIINEAAKQAGFTNKAQ